MELWQVALIVASLFATTGAFIYLAIRLQKISTENATASFNKQADEDVEHIFSDAFREELRNRGRLHFEKIITENAMFLEQDLRITIAQLNEYLKDEITKKLKEEFTVYQESITVMKDMASESITKTQQAIEQQRQAMGKQLEQEIATEKARLTKHFEDNMAQIVNHYVLEAVGDQIDLNDQLEYILAQFEENKKSIIEDINNGA